MDESPYCAMDGQFEMNVGNCNSHEGRGGSAADFSLAMDGNGNEGDAYGGKPSPSIGATTDGRIGRAPTEAMDGMESKCSTLGSMRGGAAKIAMAMDGNTNGNGGSSFSIPSPSIGATASGGIAVPPMEAMDVPFVQMESNCSSFSGSRGGAANIAMAMDGDHQCYEDSSSSIPSPSIGAAASGGIAVPPMEAMEVPFVHED